AAKEHPVVAEAMPYWFKPLALESDAARKAHDLFYDDQRHHAEMERRKPKPLSPSPEEHVGALLTRFESGDLDAWWKLCRWLEVKDDGHYCQKHRSADIRELVGWQKASAEMRGRMIAAAHRYVCSRSSCPEDWFSRKNIIHFPSVGGFSALVLLAHEAPAQ